MSGDLPQNVAQETTTDSGADGRIEVGGINVIAHATVTAPAVTQNRTLQADSAMENGNSSLSLKSDDAVKSLTPSGSATDSKNETTMTKRPLNLLDLPFDILREIMKEITITHDLTSLALTCSALHSLAIPSMYSRFDIIWPEPIPVVDTPTGVDALSYGLATLVMGANVFKEVPSGNSRGTICQNCGCDGSHLHREHNNGPALRTNYGHFRIGNQYALWTKKFCVSNGPKDWVQEYVITKEMGKLLGTLVALAVARMVNLESFVWDMPTGVIRDVFLALASLDARSNSHGCRLERVWVRWHDNSQKSPLFHIWPDLRSDMYRRVEHPTFSVLPPLKSLSVLNIDEPAYLEEMAILINRSRDRLVELRIGISEVCCAQPWVFPTEYSPSTSNTPQRSCPGWPRAGGVISVLLNEPESKPAPTKRTTRVQWIEDPRDMEMTARLLDLFKVNELQDSGSPRESTSSGIPAYGTSASTTPIPSVATGEASSEKQAKLNLETLELENVVIHAPLLIQAVEMTRLTRLTILHCDQHETLWRLLRRQYSPETEMNRDEPDQQKPDAYPLKLKHLHTDRVSTYLMLFLKEAIAPNTLESIYFQEAKFYTSVVNIEAIYRHVLRRHRDSLKKVLIDRSRRGEEPSLNNGHWREWMLPREALAFVTSGKMPQLRELAIGMDHRDWHFFLQRLPKIANLRALYLPNLYDSTLGRNRHRELALQILDIITLRPEIRLCYIGIEHKCFEIVETPLKEKSGRASYNYSPWYSDSESNEAEDQINNRDSDSETEEDDDDADADADDDENDDAVHPEGNAQLNLDLNGDSDDGSEYRYGSNGSRCVFRIREILFYDDKISIFKARHCSL